MIFFFYPVYSILFAGAGLAEVTISTLLDENKLPNSDPFWLTMRALFLSFSINGVIFALLYNPLKYRMIVIFIALVLSTPALFISFVVLKKAYLYYSTMILMIANVVLTFIIGYLAVFTSLFIWIGSTVLLYFTRKDMEIKFYAEEFDKIHNVLAKRYGYFIIMTLSTLLGILRLHGIVLL